METKYDVAIVGAGPGGYVAALLAAKAKQKVVLVEKSELGGMCLNWGCIPSKSLIESASIYKKIKNADAWGLTGVDFSAVRIDWSKMKERAKSNVQKLRHGISSLLKQNKIDYIVGEASQITPTSLIVSGDKVLYSHLILATGSHYQDFPLGNIAETQVYTPKNIFEMDSLPETITIVGAGVVGLEYAMLFASLNVRVTVYDQQAEVMGYLDDDVKRHFLLALKKQKIKLITGQKITTSPSGVVLNTTNRKGNIFGLEELIAKGMEIENGFIKTDLRQRTSIPGVYAIGDVNGRFLLAHVASREAIVAVNEIVGNGEDIIYDLMPYNMYTSPEVAAVGLSEKAARIRGFVPQSAKFPFAANGKSLIEDDTDGFVKVVFDQKTQEVLGVHIIGAKATDLIGEAILLLKLEGRVEDFASLTHPHPTLVEVFGEVGQKGIGKPIHTV